MKSNCFRRLRDPEGKGMLGCVIVIVLIAVAIYLTIVLAPIYYTNFNFEAEVKTEVSRAGARFIDNETVIKDIMDTARKEEIRIKKEDISIDRFAGQIHVVVHYSVPVNFIVLESEVKFNIKASSFIGSL
jgi:hypothetical protein